MSRRSNEGRNLVLELYMAKISMQNIQRVALDMFKMGTYRHEDVAPAIVEATLIELIKNGALSMPDEEA